jgi:hypothetical protein
MRNHRLFGVVIAVLLSSSLLHARPSAARQHHLPAPATTLGRDGIQLASATLPVHSPVVPVSPGAVTRISLWWLSRDGLGPSADRLVSSPLALPAPAGPAPPSPATAAAGSAGAAPAPSDSNIGLLRPAGTRYVRALLAWEAYMLDHPPAPPAPVVTAAVIPHVAPAVPPSVAPSVTPHVAPAVTSHPAPAPAPPTPPTIGGVWAGLRGCESGGNYAENTGNGYYGAYQFSLSTWHGLGFTGIPSDAPPAVQDAGAQRLQARSGWGQWPGCSRKLRLT